MKSRKGRMKLTITGARGSTFGDESGCVFHPSLTGLECWLLPNPRGEPLGNFRGVPLAGLGAALRYKFGCRIKQRPDRDGSKVTHRFIGREKGRLTMESRKGRMKFDYSRPFNLRLWKGRFMNISGS